MMEMKSFKKYYPRVSSDPDQPTRPPKLKVHERLRIHSTVSHELASEKSKQQVQQQIPAQARVPLQANDP